MPSLVWRSTISVPGASALWLREEHRECLGQIFCLSSNVESERFVVSHRVHAIGPPFDDRRTGSGECVHSVGQQCGDLAGDGGLFVVESDADTKILQPGVA